MKNYELMTNAELRVALVEMENEYEAVKENIRKNIEKMTMLDESYDKITTILFSRTKGVI